MNLPYTKLKNVGVTQETCYDLFRFDDSFEK